MDYLCYKTLSSALLIIISMLLLVMSPAGAPPHHIGKVPSCPVKLLDLVVRVRQGDPVCCSLLQGLTVADVAACLCTTLKLLNPNLYVPIALQILLTCGNTPPPGYTCYI